MRLGNILKTWNWDRYRKRTCRYSIVVLLGWFKHIP